MIIPSWKLGTTEIRNNSKHPAWCQIKWLEKKMHVFLFTCTFSSTRESILAPLRNWPESILCDIYVYGTWVIWNNSSEPHIKSLQMQYQNHILYCSVLFYLKTRIYAFNGLSDFLGGFYLSWGNILALVGCNF